MFFLSKRYAHSGTQSIRGSGRLLFGSVLSAQFVAARGRTYTMSGWAYCPVADPLAISSCRYASEVGMLMMAMDLAVSGRTMIGALRCASVPGIWVPCEYTFTVPGSAGSTNVRVSWQVGQVLGAAANSILFFDDLAVKEGRGNTGGSESALVLTKTNPSKLVVDSLARYDFLIANKGNGAAGQNPLTVYDQLPPNIAFDSAGSNSPSTVRPICAVTSGTVATGQLLTCSVQRLAGHLPADQSIDFFINVKPSLAAAGQLAVNRAAVDPTGQNAPISSAIVANCTATDQPQAGCAATLGITVSTLARLELTLNTSGGNDSFVIDAGTDGNGFKPTTITTHGGIAASGKPAQGSGSMTPQGLNPGVSTVTFRVPAGWAASSGRCTVNNQVGEAVPGGASFTVTGETGIFSFDASATAAGQVIRCVANLAQLPRLQLSLLRLAGSGSMTFTTQPSPVAGNGYQAQTFVSPAASSVLVAGKPQATQVLAATGTSTQIIWSSPPGWGVSAASCLDANSALSGNPSAPFNVDAASPDLLTLSSEHLPAGATLACTVNVAQAGHTVSGQVLQDNGAGSGNAHDGVRNGAEAGRAGVTLSLEDCHGNAFASTLTDLDGRFTLSTVSAQPGPVCLIEKSESGAWLNVSSQAGNTAGQYAPETRTLKFNLRADTDYNGILFGEVPISLLSGEGHQRLQAGQSTTYAHTFHSGTSASVLFSISDLASPSEPAWTSSLFLDTQCNASLDPADSALTEPVAVSAGQIVCLLVRVSSPPVARDGSWSQTTLTAKETFQPAPQFEPLVRLQKNIDISTLGSATSGALTLIKEVRSVTSCPSAAADTLPFAASNTALPGSYLEYRLTYSNFSNSPVTGIQIADTVPPYTEFQTADCGPLPAGLATCAVTHQPAPSATGPVTWKLTDSATAPVGLQSGGSGNVRLCLRLSQ
jgi:uncharacterized repeat protein (TIGR01451 family)